MIKTAGTLAAYNSGANLVAASEDNVFKKVQSVKGMKTLPAPITAAVNTLTL